ncbi:MAG: helix-turn-helix transcriptional regulator [Sediminibacterium sp.]|jgi:DNA-binding CsgD family transcriptional regulator|nr:helix-turn-helix transcriptional regulator [Sediminibacterium sp.]
MNNEIIIKSLEKYKLSNRENHIALLILDGKRTLDIALELGIKPNTVSTIKKNIFYKTGVRTIVDLYKILLSNK